jgi:3-hydroxybutyryl-CoA dehydrogenase
MHVAILANEQQKAVFLQKGFPATVQVTWADTLKTLQMASTVDVYMDMAFRVDAERIAHLQKLLPKPILINAVVPTLTKTGDCFIRFNGWPSFLERKVIELSATQQHNSTIAAIFNTLQWHYLLTPDVPGMITARVIAAIINEAYHAVAEGISTPEAIDTAMKLGTHYPYGPFEWSQIIGIKNIYELMKSMQQENNRYDIADGLLAAAVNF